MLCCCRIPKLAFAHPVDLLTWKYKNITGCALILFMQNKHFLSFNWNYSSILFITTDPHWPGRITIVHHVLLLHFSNILLFSFQRMSLTPNHLHLLTLYSCTSHVCFPPPTPYQKGFELYHGKLNQHLISQALHIETDNRKKNASIEKQILDSWWRV